MSRQIKSTNFTQGLPHPTLSSPRTPLENGMSVCFQKSRWKAFKDAIRIGTGYASKPPEWSGSTLDFSQNNDAQGEEEDAVLDGDDLGWITGQDGGDALALVLVEKSHSTTSQASPNRTSSQEHLPNYHTQPVPRNNASDMDVADRYRLKGYEGSFHGTQSSIITPFSWLWYRTVPWIRRAFHRYCYPEFNDPEVEAVYADHVYQSQKFLTFVCSAWLVMSWLIALTLLSKDLFIADTIFFYAIAPALTVPLPFMVFFDLPKRLPHVYQIYLVLSVWSWSAYTIAFLKMCDYYGTGFSLFSCGARDTINLFYYMIALPVIALFGLGQHRTYGTLAPLIMIVAPTILFYRQKHAWVRFAFEHLFLQALLLYIHWRREILERNVYYINKKVKDTLITLHQTRVHQSRIEAARARSTGYIFHEVRQPLSAAFLAYQNLAASTSIRQDQKFEWDTLRIKLMSMSKLLNDVLDQKRMDAGKFEIVSRPFSFHSIVRQTIVGSQMAADTKNQELIVDLDKNIDQVARIGMYSAQRRTNEEIQRLLNASPDDYGILTGDETRLSQVLSNLLSNSSKFTPANGKIRVNTRLISPRSTRTSLSTNNAPGSSSPRLRPRTHSQQLLTPPASRSNAPSATSGTNYLSAGEGVGGKWEEDHDRLVVRIEVIDTGCGISPSDVKERRLFSPYAQAGVGRFQGGSGTGLGLSLVRRIVKLMGGRMGVESVPAAGTTFWVELPLRVALGPVASPMEGMLVAPSIVSLPMISERDAPASGTIFAHVAPTNLMTPPLVSSPMGSYTSAQPTGVRQGENSGTAHSDTTGSVPLSPLSARAGTGESAQTAPTTPGEPFSISTQSSIGMGLSILVVDDDPILRGLLQRLLTRLGCNVEGAENGQVALRKLGMTNSVEGRASGSGPEQEPHLQSPLVESNASSADRTFDVIFLDNQMPKMTGPEVASVLRKSGRKDFLVGLSGDTGAADQAKFRQAGVDDFLSKPVLEFQVRKILQIARERGSSKDSPEPRDPQPP